MRIRLKSLLCAAAAAAALTPVAAGAEPMLGFTAKDADAERAAEAQFDGAISPAEIDARLKLLAAAPNQVGSPHDKANAEFVLSELKSWGWDAHMEVFQVLYPTPKHEALELLGPTPFTASLTEPPVPGDATSAVREGALPPTSPTPPTATSPPSWSTSTTACPTTTPPWRGWAWT